MDNIKIDDFINKIIEKANRPPFLFIGSGFSKRYLKLENWEELLRKFAYEFSDDDFKYDAYVSQIEERDYYGKQPQVATLLEKDYNKAILEKEKYKEFRNKFSKEIRTGISSFKLSIAEYFKNIDFSTINETDPEIVELRKMAIRSVSGIITTNYDLFIENIFKNYKTYIGQEELIFSDIFEVGEIYKIHGSAMDPSSIVITSEDYKKFEEKSAYLIAKILTIFLEYPIIFIGYSIQDRNIQNILKSISTCLTQEKLDLLKERFIFVEYSLEKEEITSLVKSFENGNEISMTKITTNRFEEIYKGINKSVVRISPKVLRTLKKQIYSLVETTNPTSKILAAGFDTIDKLDEDVQIMASIGIANKNGHLVRADQLYKDLIFDNQYFDVKLLLKEHLPSLLKTNSGGLPMYKYIKEEPTLLFERVKEHYIKKQTIDDFLNAQQRENKKKYRKNLKSFNIEEIIEKEGKENAYKKIYFLEKPEINLQVLEEYLKEAFKSLELDSELKRLIRIYDFLKYK